MESSGDGPGNRSDAPPRRLRVCILIPKLQIGGAEVQVLHLMKHLDKGAFAVFVCCMQPGDAQMEREAESHTEFLLQLRFRWRNLPFSVTRLVSFLRRYRIDILHCHLGLADSIGRCAGRLAGVPVLMTTEHGKHLWKTRPHLLFERILNRITDMRICVSRDIMELRAEREGTPREKLTLIPNAVAPAEFERPQRGRAAVMNEFGWHVDDPLVVSVGRLVVAKDYPLLVESIGLIRTELPNVRCLIVGEGDCRGSIEERIAALDLGENVTIAGYRRDVADILGAADVFTLSSIREGLPVSLLEAMAAGKAIVGTDVGGIPDAITDGSNGLIVPPRDARALAEAVGGLLGDAGRRKTIGAAAAETVAERFNVKVTTAQVAGLYRSLYEGSARAPEVARR
jgi:glycosyltransferase involved in cell wall biosynthesis